VKHLVLKKFLKKPTNNYNKIMFIDVPMSLDLRHTLKSSRFLLTTLPQYYTTVQYGWTTIVTPTLHNILLTEYHIWF